MRKWALLTALVVLFALLGSKALGRAHAFVAFLDVGQGDAILIQLPDSTTILVDAGPDASILEQLGRAMPFTDHTIELAIATHPDADHYTGFATLLDAYAIRELWVSGAEKEGAWEEFLHEARRRNVTVSEPKQGKELHFSAEASLEVLWPPAGFVGESNDTSIVVRFTQEDDTFLLTGDAGVAIEERLIAAYPDLTADALKLGHHGSRSSTSATFLAAVHPAFAIISAGADNRYGHPHEEVLEKLNAAGIPYMRTDLFSTILFPLEEELFPQHLDKICFFC